MEYQFLGRSGLQVSRLCFGTMTFGGGDYFKHMGSASSSQAHRLIDLCLEAGINLFDTADAYSQGASEELLGEAIGAERRKKVLISTKVFFPMGPEMHDRGSSRRHLIEACENSLRRLKTDWIDLYHLHGFDSFTPLEETLSALNQLVLQGKVRYIGCSNFSAWHIMKGLSIAEKRGFERFISGQMNYSLVARELENELIPLCLDQGLGILVWSPLAYGALSGKYRPNTPKKPQDTRLGSIDEPGTIDWPRLYQIVDVLETIARARGKTIPQVALNWLLRRPGITSLILGARNEKQLQENLGAVGWALTEEEVRRLEAVSATPELYPYWHQHTSQLERNPFFQREYCP
jgi:aryl-alcohol dehydrogenase-like predicted oxidoreductase